MDFQSMMCESKIDFTNAVISVDCGTRLYHKFEIEPNQYISFAKSDFKKDCIRGRINGLSNAKRAVDCQVDKILLSLGYSTESLPDNLTAFIEEFCEEQTPYPKKLRLINALGMAPCSIISDVRTLRNKMEHDYDSPNSIEVKQAIEISELFVAATDRRLMDVWDFQITDKKKIVDGLITGLMFSFNYEGAIKCKSFSHNTRPEIDIKSCETIFPYLMRMCFYLEQEEEVNRALKDILKCIGHPIPGDKVNVTIV